MVLELISKEGFQQEICSILSDDGSQLANEVCELFKEYFDKKTSFQKTIEKVKALKYRENTDSDLKTSTVQVAKIQKI